MESQTGVTVNTALGVFGNATVQGNLAVTGTVSKANVAFDAYNSAQTTLSTTNNVLVVVGLDTSRLSTPSGAFSLSGGVVTVNTAGLYQVTYRVSTYATSGTVRSVSQAQLSLNGTEVPGTRAFMYNRQLDVGHGTGSSSCLLQLSSGDQLRVGAMRIFGSSPLAAIAHGCSLTLLAL